MPEDREYDATFQIGNALVHIVAPEITEGERQQTLGEVQRVNWALWNEIQKRNHKHKGLIRS